jgi:peptidoglycan/xylan/chitin deacetylase (PgdA/CDA1 family)/CelD/BcsL family acetyltransferase involved in cellulose biosynthesis
VSDRLLIFAWHSVAGTWAYPFPAEGGARGFERQLAKLSRVATVVPLAPALQRLGTGQRLPPRAVALTFDDGYQDNLDVGVPLLERFSLPATFFLVPGILSGTVRPWWESVAWAFAHTPRASVTWEGRLLATAGRPGREAFDWVTERLKERDQDARHRSVADLLALLEPDGALDTRDLFLDWDSAGELVRRGFSVGGHSMDHAILSRESAEAQVTDLTESRALLEGELGVVVDLLAYPNGRSLDYDARTIDAARRAGYTHALTARAGWNSRTTSLFEVRRVVLDPSHGFAEAAARRVTGRLARLRRSSGGAPLPAPSTNGQVVTSRAEERPEPLRIEPASLESLRDDWTGLASQTGNIFATWEWASAWWRRFGEGREPLLTACRAADGRLAGIIPLYLWRSRPVSVLRFIGHGAGDELGPIHAPGEQDAVADAARRALAAHRFRVFLGEHLPARALWSDALGAKVIAREGSPVLRAPDGGWSGYLAGRSSNFRQQLGRRERNLARSYRLVFRLVEDPEELPEAMEALFRLHGLRWEVGSSAFEPRAAFHKEFAATALERGWLRLWLMELDGRPAAAWYGFRFGDVEWFYQSGRDPAFDNLSVGFVLLAHSIREAFENGAREYRFGRGHDPYKYRFTTEDPGLETISLTRGRAAGTALAAARNAYPLVKGRLGRLRWEIT